jgi:hypothetical protein
MIRRRGKRDSLDLAQTKAFLSIILPVSHTYSRFESHERFCIPTGRRLFLAYMPVDGLKNVFNSCLCPKMEALLHIHGATTIELNTFFGS